MKIIINRVKREDIAKFADRHKLVMEVNERSNPGLAKYYAHFRGVEVKSGSILCGESGDGETPEEAIADYARRISGKVLVRGAFCEDRKEMIAPILTYRATH